MHVSSTKERKEREERDVDDTRTILDGRRRKLSVGEERWSIGARIERRNEASNSSGSPGLGDITRCLALFCIQSTPVPGHYLPEGRGSVHARGTDNPLARSVTGTCDAFRWLAEMSIMDELRFVVGSPEFDACTARFCGYRLIRERNSFQALVVPVSIQLQPRSSTRETCVYIYIFSLSFRPKMTNQFLPARGS